MDIKPNTRFTYLAMNGTWQYGTILSKNADGTYTARLDCQHNDANCRIHPDEISHCYFIVRKEENPS